MLKIYGADLSSPSNKVRFVANILNLEYEYIRVKIKEGENKTQEFLELHPAGKIPVVNDEGFVLFESNAIIKYLCKKNESDLYPKDMKVRAIIDQWMDFVSIHVGGATDRIVFNKIIAPKIQAPADERSIKVGMAFLNRFLPVIDKQLSRHPYLVGTKITLADINLLSVLDPYDLAKISLAKYENIQRIQQELMKESFYKKCHDSYREQYLKIFGEPVPLL